MVGGLEGQGRLEGWVGKARLEVFYPVVLLRAAQVQAPRQRGYRPVDLGLLLFTYEILVVG